MRSYKATNRDFYSKIMKMHDLILAEKKLSVETLISLRQQSTCPFICKTKLSSLQLTVDTVTLETGQNVLLNVMEELRQEVELVQTLLLQTEELTV